MKRPKAPQIEPLQELGVVAVNYDYHVNELNAYIDHLEAKAENLPISKVRICSCAEVIKTGTTAVRCCNICGLPDEMFWR